MFGFGTVIPMAQFDVERPPKQHTLTALFHANLQEEFTDGTRPTSRRTCSIRKLFLYYLQLFHASMSLPESKAWTVSVDLQRLVGRIFQTANFVRGDSFTVKYRYFSREHHFQDGIAGA